jgi:hypothetical protein
VISGFGIETEAGMCDCIFSSRVPEWFNLISQAFADTPEKQRWL